MSGKKSTTMKDTWEKVFDYASSPVSGTISRPIRTGDKEGQAPPPRPTQTLQGIATLQIYGEVMKTNPLGVVKNILERVGMDISFAYEDLIFLEHTGFLLQFSDNDKEILVHMNSEADEAMVSRDIGTLVETALHHDMRFLKGQRYTLAKEDEEHIRIKFSPTA